ncbi:cystatin-B-like [Amphiura filiformis]|uniref:cystatin-B-like n=1 Tax=Amphiura filiformis TaxID=82378 RepID=UPI003B21E78D
MAGMCGGMKSPEPASKECQTYVDQVREPAEAKAGRSFSKFEAKLCATQLVNGINYFVKVDVGDNQFVHIRFHRSFQGEISFHSLQDQKSEADALVHF